MDQHFHTDTHSGAQARVTMSEPDLSKEAFLGKAKKIKRGCDSAINIGAKALAENERTSYDNRKKVREANEQQALKQANHHMNAAHIRQEGSQVQIDIFAKKWILEMQKNVKSQMEATYRDQIIEQCDKNKSFYIHEYRDCLRQKVRQELTKELESVVEAELYYNLKPIVEQRLREELGDELRSQVRDQNEAKNDRPVAHAVDTTSSGDGPPSKVIDNIDDNGGGQQLFYAPATITATAGDEILSQTAPVGDASLSGTFLLSVISSRSLYHYMYCDNAYLVSLHEHFTRFEQIQLSHYAVLALEAHYWSIHLLPQHILPTQVKQLQSSRDTVPSREAYYRSTRFFPSIDFLQNFK